MASSLINRLNQHQLKHHPDYFIYGVIKSIPRIIPVTKPIDTYYAFVALFPLLIVAITLLQLALRHHQTVKLRI